MMHYLGTLFSRLAQRYLPDAYVFALILTLIVVACAWLFTPYTFLNLVEFWGNGLWDLLAFAMQMAMVLITGATLAKTPLVEKIMSELSVRVTSFSQAVLVVTVFSVIASYLNWGFGLVFSGLLAVKLAKNLPRADMGLLLACAYSGFLVWHGGFSASIPLALSAPSIEMQGLISKSSVPLSETLFSGINLFLVLGTLVLLVTTNLFLARRAEGTSSEHESAQESEHSGRCEQVTPEHAKSWAVKAQDSRLLSFCLFGLFASYFALALLRGEAMTLNRVISAFFSISVLLHGTPSRFIKAFSSSVYTASGIFLQFPLYAGIMAVMANSGLAQLLSRGFVQVANEHTFLLLSFLSAGLLNFFVPSGGGQWALQAPILIPAAIEVGVSPVVTAIAIAWGDAWTNMIQPFWALPLLALTGRKLGDMMGYSALILFVSGAFYAATFLIYSYFL